MGRLLLKIFLAYWLAAGVVIVVSDYEPHRQIHNPEMGDALNSALALNARTLVSAYGAGRCAATLAALNARGESVALADASGRLLCGDPQVDNLAKVVAAAVRYRGRTTENYALYQLIAVPVTGADGEPYVFLMKGSYSSALHRNGLLPGYTTIAISCVVTLFLAVLLALPIRRLRKAAGQIAMGRLDARATGGWLLGRETRFTGGDDIDQLMRDFNHMAERLQLLANAQRLLLRDVSHELRTPLTRLGVGLGLARKAAAPEMRLHLDRIETEASRLNSLIGNILALSQMDSAEEIELHAVLSLKDLISDLLPDIEYEAEQRRCSIVTSFGPECLVRANPELLRTAVENILRNAIKYAGKGLIEVTAGEVKESGEQIASLTVADKGPGIPAHEIGSVLKPFYRADRPRNWEKEGSGIGLAIADRAARLHGGTISLSNRADGGLLVELRLPLAQLAAG